jgi:hypothetical protein
VPCLKGCTMLSNGKPEITITEGAGQGEGRELPHTAPRAP